VGTIRQDEELISAIADRTKDPLMHSTLVWKLKEVHFGVCPLRLTDLLAAPDEDFNREIDGINFYLDVLDGSFREGWKPKFAK
jgi:hypothetical protein